MSYYVGLDISMKETSIAIVDEKGKLVYETICNTEPADIAKMLVKTGFKLEKIGAESGSLTFWLISELKTLNVNVICIESRQMATLISLKVNKTDRNDARLIADAMRCDLYVEVYHKAKESIDAILQMGCRRTLVSIRTKFKNSIRGFLKAYGIRLGTVSHDNFPESVRKAIKECEEVCQKSIEGLLKSYEETCSNILEAEELLEKICKVDPVLQLFLTIPGVGPVTALTYKSVIDNPFRFNEPRNVGAYLGLTPKQYSSGDSTKQGRVSKCGCSELRTLLMECGISILTRSHAWTKLRAWGFKIQKRSGLNKAAAAIARKLAIIMLKMWQEMKPFAWGEPKEKAPAAKKSRKPQARESEVYLAA